MSQRCGARWFSPHELARSEAYHAPLWQATAVVAVLEVLAIASLQRWWPLSGSTDRPGFAAVQLGVAATTVGLVLRLALGLWRELRHEARHGLACHSPQRLAHATLGQHAAGVTGGRASAATAAVVVVIDQLAQAFGRALLIAGAATLAHWSARAAWPVAVVGVPLVLASMRGPLQGASWAWRRRLDSLEPVPPAEWPPPLSMLDHRAWPVPLEVFRPGPRAAQRGEGGHVVRGRTTIRLVLDRDLWAADPAEFAAVAAHELAHAQTMRYGPKETFRRWMEGFVALAAVSLLVRLAVPDGLSADGHLGPFVLALVLAADLVVLSPLAAWHSRRVEEAADRCSTQWLIDGRACADAVRRRLLADGVDLDPSGLRRLAARYPAAQHRLDLLESCSSATGHRNVIGASAPSRASAPRIVP